MICRSTIVQTKCSSYQHSIFTVYLSFHNKNLTVTNLLIQGKPAWIAGDIAIDICGLVCWSVQRFSLYASVFALNISLGIAFLVFHALGNTEVSVTVEVWFVIYNKFYVGTRRETLSSKSGV